LARMGGDGVNSYSKCECFGDVGTRIFLKELDGHSGQFVHLTPSFCPYCGESVEVTA